MNPLVYKLEKLFDNPTAVVLMACSALALYLIFSNYKAVQFIIRSLKRNKLRTILTSLAILVLVLVVTAIWTILSKLDEITEEKSKDLKAMVTEKYGARSQMPYSYARGLADGGARKPSDVHPQDNMAWSFYIGSLEKGKFTRENFMFFFCMDPEKFPTMMDEVDTFSPTDLAILFDSIKKMKADKKRIMVGKERLKLLNKRVGDRIKLFCQNYKDIDLEFEVCGTLPEGRYENSAVMNIDYLQDAIDGYARDHKGEKHPQADKALTFMFLKTEDRNSFERLAEQISTSSLFTNPAVKCDTASSGVASFLDAYRDLLWGMRWLLVPAILVTMALVISNAISISVRERRTEMAVLKVLGFSPSRILFLVLGEALFVGVLSGLVSSGGLYLLINGLIGGIPFPIGWFGKFEIPLAAWWWGPAIGGGTAFAGSFFPAWSARTVKVSEVFSKIG
jgi:putative ABC transport system permease protein